MKLRRVHNFIRMTQIKKFSRILAEGVKKGKKSVNWYPGHMYAGLQAMIGKLNTVDCVVEVHDARIPFTGRNKEFKKHLGLIKPHILLLNKSDLADLSRWDEISSRLKQQGDENLLLTDLRGFEMTTSARGYDKLLEMVVDSINRSDRFNRAGNADYKIMIAGIPNVGKSTLINRLRNRHLGRKGEATRVGPEAGVTRHVENIIKICGRPSIYSLDTPGILEPSLGVDKESTLRLALCSSVSDKVLKSLEMAEYLLAYLNGTENYTYLINYDMIEPVKSMPEFAKHYNNLQARLWDEKHCLVPLDVKQTLKQYQYMDLESVCWKFIRDFRKGLLGQVMFI